jgi:hypothetical protein
MEQRASSSDDQMIRNMPGTVVRLVVPLGSSDKVSSPIRKLANAASGAVCTPRAGP